MINSINVRISTLKKILNLENLLYSEFNCDIYIPSNKEWQSIKNFIAFGTYMLPIHVDKISLF